LELIVLRKAKWLTKNKGRLIDDFIGKAELHIEFDDQL